MGFRVSDLGNSARQTGTASSRVARWPFLLIALLIIMVVLAAWAERTRVPFLSNLEGQVIDLQHRIRGPLTPGTAPALSILMVDDRSILELGRLPVARSVLARAVDRLKADGATLVVIDMLLADPTRDGVAEDAELATAIRNAGNVVLPFALLHVEVETEPVPGQMLDSAFMRYRNETMREILPFKPAGVLQPLPEFAEAAFALGNVGVLLGHDGTLRFDLPALWFEDELYPSMALRVAALARGVPWNEVEASLGDKIEFGSQTLPLDAVSRQWVNFYGSEGKFATYSFADYVAGRLEPILVRDRIVLIGGSALGSSDRYPSPFDPALPGVERLATVVDNLLTGRWLSRPSWAALVELAGIVLLPLLAVGTISRVRPLPALGFLAVVGIVTMALAQVAFEVGQQFVGVAYPMAALLLSSGLGIGFRAWGDERSRRQAEARLRASEQRYALSAHGANDGLWDWEVGSDLAYFSPRWRELLGLETSDALVPLEYWTGRLDQFERERFRRELEAHLKGDTRQFLHVFRYLRAGEERWFLARGIAVREGSKPVRMAGSITDLTEQKRLEQQIAFDAIHDRLTGLPNRNYFLDQTDQLLSLGTDGQSAGVGVVVIDIDDFLGIHNRHGQLACNSLLVECAERLSALPNGSRIVGHLGNDQFALAYRGVEDEALVSAVLQIFKTPFRLDAFYEQVSATIGVAHSTQGLDAPGDLLGAASLAAATGKRHNRGQIYRFDPASQEVENSRHWLSENIRLALDAGDQFELHYQPFIDLADRRLLGFEALIRWRHPERGMVMPGEFIPFAEESGQINEIGPWTMTEAAKQLVVWDKEGFDGEIAVNLSGRQFMETDLESDARDVLGILGDVDASRIKLEVTESMSMANPQRTTEILQRLADMGFKISIDDFGTGYSSLAYLHRFPFNTLKIDRSFVMRLGSGREAQEIVRTISGLARTLDKQVLAEGVEDEEQASTLLALGVEVGQGWLFARPLPAERAREWFVGQSPARPAR